MKVTVKKIVETPAFGLGHVAIKQVSENIFHLFIDCEERYFDITHGGSSKDGDMIFIGPVDGELEWEICFNGETELYMFESRSKYQTHFVVVKSTKVFGEMNKDMQVIYEK